jgi:hypothetical protein
MLAALAFAACSNGDDDSASDAAFGESATDAPAELSAGGDGAEVAAPDADTQGAPAPTGIDLGSIGRDVIVEMRVSMTTTDLRAAVQGISRAARLREGGIAASDVDYGTPTTAEEAPTGYATLVVKVPPAQIDSVIDDLAGLGTVTSVGTDSQDVTDQLRDLDVEIENAAASVDRVRDLLAQATDLRTIVEIEADLTARQTRLEQLTALQADLEGRVALATLTIDVRAVAPGDGDAVLAESDDGIADAWATGWDAFVGVLFTIGFAAAVLAPFLAVIAVIAAVVLVVLRGTRRDRRREGAVAVADVSSDEELEPASRRT